MRFAWYLDHSLHRNRRNYTAPRAHLRNWLETSLPLEALGEPEQPEKGNNCFF